MESKEKRKSLRKDVSLTSYVRKEMPDGKYVMMQFLSRDISEGGIFICTDDLSLFDLGEELTIMVDRNKEKLYEGKVRTVRSARSFENEGRLTDSGYGMMFLDIPPAFSAMVKMEL